MTLEELKHYRYNRLMIDYYLEKIMVLQLSKRPQWSWPKEVSHDSEIPERIAAMSTDEKQTELERIQEEVTKFEEAYIMTQKKISRIYSKRLRLIIEYRFLEDLTWKEVAEKLAGNATENAVKQSFRHFLKRQQEKAPS